MPDISSELFSIEGHLRTPYINPQRIAPACGREWAPIPSRFAALLRTGCVGQLNCIPSPSFRGWLWIPPHFSVRTELKPLYAVLLHVECPSAEVFFAVRAEYLRRYRRTDSAAATVVPLPVAPVSQAAGAAAHREVTASAAVATGTDATPVMAYTETSNAARALASGAGILTGATLLAWNFMGYASHDGAASPLAAYTPARTSRRLGVEPIARRETVWTGAIHSEPAPVALPGSASSAPVTGHAEPTDSRVARTAKSISVHARHEFHTVRYRHAHARHDPTSLVTTKLRTKGAFSVSSLYSPDEPRAQLYEDYASIIEYASTSLGPDALTAPRDVTRSPIPADSTERVDHVSQRRVTEIPDEFRK